MPNACVVCLYQSSVLGSFCKLQNAYPGQRSVALQSALDLLLMTA